ncbi:MAG: ABC1 kinase family protein [Pseudomonadota bacterium]
MSDRKPNDRTREKVQRIKTGALERRFSLARAGFVAGTRFALQSAGNLFASGDRRAQRQREILSDQAQYLVRELGKLKGSVVKIGQMMALLGEHFLPDEVTAALHTLESETTALAWPAMERHLREQLGARMDELDIDTEPLGAASLGQVHKARRRSDGRELALKIQYPGVAAAIDSDLDAVVQLLRLTRLVPITEEFQGWLEEVRSMLRREVDYRLELETTRHFGDILRDDARFRVPDVFPEYSTGSVLCTSFERGVGVSDPAVLALPQERRNRIGRAIMDICCREVFVWNKMQTDPNFGNYLIQIAGTPADEDRIVLLDFGAFRDFDEKVLGPGREMIRASYFRDRERLFKAMRDLEFLHRDVPQKNLDQFAELCFMAVEVLADPDVHPMPDYVLNEKKEYLWGRSDLPDRVMLKASKSALSVHFDVPPKEFIFLARKLLGAYTFLHVIRAEVRGDTILRPYL